MRLETRSTDATAERQIECAICRKVDHVFLYRPRLSPGPVVRCRSCGLIYVNPVERPERLVAGGTETGQLFEADESSSYRDLYLAEAPVKCRLYNSVLDQIETVTKTCGTLLDVGSYLGLFLQTATARGWRCKGIEPDRDAWAHVRQTAGLDVCWGTLDTCHWPVGTFDAITMLQVLEHLSDPRRALLQVRDLLRPGGALVVEVPNIDCWPVRVLGRHHRHFAKHHFTFFGPNTLTPLLRDCGFETLRLSYPVRYISGRLLEFGLQSWYPRLGTAVAPVLEMARVRERVFALNLHEVLSICAQKNGRRSGAV